MHEKTEIWKHRTSSLVLVVLDYSTYELIYIMMYYSMHNTGGSAKIFMHITRVCIQH